MSKIHKYSTEQCFFQFVGSNKGCEAEECFISIYELTIMVFGHCWKQLLIFRTYAERVFNILADELMNTGVIHCNIGLSQLPNGTFNTLFSRSVYFANSTILISFWMRQT